MTKKEKSSLIVDTIMDGIYDKVLEAENLIDKYLDIVTEKDLSECGGCMKKSMMGEHEDNAIPEVPIDSATAGKDIKDALSQENPEIDNESDTEESERNDIPDVPDQSKTAGKDIKTALESVKLNENVIQKINKALK